MNKQQDKLRYKTFPIRLADETREALKKKKVASGKSWNLFICELLKTNKK